MPPRSADDLRRALVALDELSERLRVERARRGLLQSEAAAEVGISQQQWSRYERGDYFPRRTSLTLLVGWLAESEQSDASSP